MRQLISEGKLVRIVPQHKKGGELKTETITAEGPVAAISTSTKNLKIDDETRHMSIWVDQSEEQTRRIVKALVKDTERVTQQELKIWHMVHRILRKMMGTVVVFPKWFAEIADQVPIHDPRVRRYFPAFIQACRTVCLMRCFQPGRKRRNDHLEVDFADFAITALLFDHVFVESLHLRSGAGEVTRRAVEAITNKTGKPVRAEDLAQELKISMHQAYNKLRSAARAGVIRLANEPEKTNRKTYRAVDEPHFVPDPKKLFRKLKLKERVSFVHPRTGEKVVYKPRRH